MSLISLLKNQPKMV